MKTGTTLGLGVFGLLGLLIFAYIIFVIYLNWPKDRTIATSLWITHEWTDVAIDPAVTPAKRSHSINLRIKDFKVDRNSNSLDIKLSDGTIVEPEIELYDEFGEKFVFHHSGFAMKIFDDVVFTSGPERQFLTLPADRKYTKLRIRSEIPFSCGHLYWRDYDPK